MENTPSMDTTHKVYCFGGDTNVEENCALFPIECSSSLDLDLASRGSLSHGMAFLSPSPLAFSGLALSCLFLFAFSYLLFFQVVTHLQKSWTLQTANFCAFYTTGLCHWCTTLLRTWLPTGSNLFGATEKVALIQGYFV